MFLQKQLQKFTKVGELKFVMDDVCKLPLDHFIYQLGLMEIYFLISCSLSFPLLKSGLCSWKIEF